MGKLSAQEWIIIQGAREHNLCRVDARLPRGKLTVVTGVSGSGKSTLVFDTLHAEGYRKYLDSLSIRTRQLLDQVPRPEVDYISGLPPVIAVEQRSGGGGPRTTLAGVTEVADFARLLWAVCGEPRCPSDGGRILRQSLDDSVERLLREPVGTRLQLLAPILTAKPGLIREELPRLRQRGYQRVRLDGEIRTLDDIPAAEPRGSAEVTLELVVDRVVIGPDQRRRLADSLELAFREGHNRASALLQRPGETELRETALSQHLACETCGTVHEPVTPRCFQNHRPEGACPECHGHGETRRFAPELVVPEENLSVNEGAVRPWTLGGPKHAAEHAALLRQLASQLPFDADAPWEKLSGEVRHSLLHGAGERLFSFGKKKSDPGESRTFPGVLAHLEETFRHTANEGLRARLSAFQTSQPCGPCGGSGLGPASRSVLLGGRSYPDFLSLGPAAAHAFVRGIRASHPLAPKLGECLNGLEDRLRLLGEIGLDYLGLDRAFHTLSGGEAQRARLATQLGNGLVGACYVLDEPSVGLHPHDNHRLLRALADLRDRGNTVVVVEHDEDAIRAADHLLELGPGAGTEGGRLMFAGTPSEAEADPRSLTGSYLSGRERIRRTAAGRLPTGDWIRIKGARAHNLNGIDARFPIGLLTTVTGVSGSGKSTLVNDILGAAAAFKLNGSRRIPLPHSGLTGLQHFTRAVLVDQDPAGQSPRSNPATFVKIFDPLRELFASCPLSKVRGYDASRFSFNLPGGRCERCQGAGAIELDLQFLADASVVCPSCSGARYNRETLEVRFKGLSIADVLALTVREARDLLRHHPKIAPKLDLLDEVGLGYLKLGQSSATLSGGEAQRLKLALELGTPRRGPALFLLDEPTTGLHWADIQKLLDVLFRLRDAGHTLIIIEHNLDVVRLSDWTLDLGPGGGPEGGRILFEGHPNDLAQNTGSPTGRCLAENAKRFATA